MLLEDLKEKIFNNNLSIKFVSILVGTDSASSIYLKNKRIKCEYVGIEFELINFDENISEEILIKKIKEINIDNKINGCIIQLPLPNHLNTENILNTLDPNKDIDCFNTVNIGMLTKKTTKFVPATPLGITLLLKHYNIETKGKNVVIIGKSIIVGTPLALILSNENTFAATVTLCDKYTENLNEIVKNADILIVAAGVHKLINSKFKVKLSSCLIDVGIHKVQDISKKLGYRLEGDIDFNYFKDKCKYITPVPGGVGPMTVYSLLYNLYKSI